MSIRRATRMCVLGGFVALVAGCADDARTSTLEQRVRDLLGELSDTNNRLDDSTARSNMLTQQLEILDQERGALANELAKASNELGTRSAGLRAARARLSAATKTAATQLARFDLAAHAGVELDAQLEALGDSLASASARAEDARAAATAELQALAQMRDAMRDGWDSERERAANNDEIVRSLYADYQQALAQIQALETSKVYLEDQITHTEKHTIQVGAELVQTQAQLRAATITREALEIATTELSSRTAIATTEARRLGEAETYLFKLFQDRGVELQASDAQLQSKSQEALGLAVSLADALAQRDALVTERDTLRAELDDGQAHATSLSNFLKQTETELDTGVLRAKTTESEAASLDKKIAELSAQLAKAQQLSEAAASAAATRSSAQERAMRALGNKFAAERARTTALETELAQALAQTSAKNRPGPDPE